MVEPVIIGDATLYCGDAYEIRPTLGWMDADVCDPPYLFDNSGGGKWRNDRGASDQIVDEGLTEGFDHRIINPLLCGAAVVFCHGDQIAALKAYLDGSFRRVAMLHWLKSNPAPHRNKHYLADKEDYFHAWNAGYHPVGEHHDMHRHVTAPVQPSKLFGHPTVKPDSVMDKIIANVNGATICDSFTGTGSTGVAAIKAGKQFFGIEKNERHFAVACSRLADAYGARDAA
jgi:DNA modification methylase